MQNDINHYQSCESYDDFHAVMTYTFGELLDVPGGVDWNNARMVMARPLPMMTRNTRAAARKSKTVSMTGS